jgi:excisionase family DNA binding protein
MSDSKEANQVDGALEAPVAGGRCDVTVREAATKIGVSASLVYELCRQGVLRHTRHGRPGKRGTIRISEEAVTEYIVACERQQTAVDDGGAAYRRHAF